MQCVQNIEMNRELLTIDIVSYINCCRPYCTVFVDEVLVLTNQLSSMDQTGKVIYRNVNVDACIGQSS